MARLERVQVSKYHEGKEEGTYPRMIRRYSNPHNPTFKSDQLSLAIWQTDYKPPVYSNKTVGSAVALERPKQLSQREIAPLQSLDVATKQFQMKKSNLIQKSPEEIALLTNNFSGRRTPRLQLKNYRDVFVPNQQNRKVIKTRSIGRYNDASVFEWQSKPYNIISNFPKEVDTLRFSRLGNPEEISNRKFF